MKTRAMLLSVLLLPLQVWAGLPGNYGAVPYERALSNASKDGKLVIYFGEVTIVIRTGRADEAALTDPLGCPPA